MTLPSSTTSSYAYDADGRQISQTTGGVTTTFVWDEASPYGDIVLETDGSGTVQASYTLGGTNLLAQTRGGSVSYVLPDAQGSVRALANSVGEVTDTYRFDAYGNVLSHSGTTTLPYGYDGQRLDSTSGLYQLRARNYDPTTGRFLTADTATLSPTDVMQLDRYVYAGANPINMSDPSGHGFLDYALDTAVSVGGAYFAAVDLSEALALLFTEGAIDEAAAAAGADAAIVWVGTVLRAVWDVYHLVTDLNTFVHVLQQLYQAFVTAFTSGLGSGGSGSGSGGSGSGGSGGGGSGVEFVGDASFFEDTVTPYQRGVIEATLHDPSITIDVPQAAVGEIGRPGVGPTPTERARLAGYPGGALVRVVPNASLAGVDPAALVPSRNFDMNDMYILQTALELGVPVITTNIGLYYQTHSGGPRQTQWGGVQILVVPQSNQGPWKP